VDLLNNTSVTDILGFVVLLMVMLMLLFGKGFLIEPLERWVLKSIDWIGLLDSSPWLWEYALIV
jgi:hypothetical protein